MAGTRQENLQIKVPALVHLSRLGYGYLSREQAIRRDRKTNLIRETLKAAMERINGSPINERTFGRMIEEIREWLDADDLGKRFYGMIRDGWNGLKLIDYDNPENNLFQSAAELTCGNGAGCFRPDITLYINGIPLAMIEVKTRDHPGSLQTEYERMLDRFHNRETRRYLQCAQVWAFSDDHADDPYRLRPTEGTFFTTVMTDDFPIYAVRGNPPGATGRLRPGNREEEQRILKDNGIQTIPRFNEYRKSLSPAKPTHSMLTTLFQPDRFLFLLRYGIHYLWETDPAGRTSLSRRMLTIGQLGALGELRGKAKRGYRNWTVRNRGAAGEDAANAAMIHLIRDLIPGATIRWVSVDDAAAQKTAAAMEACGIPCVRWYGAAASADVIEGTNATEAVMLITMAASPETRPWEKSAEDASGRSVYILPGINLPYGQKASWSDRLRKSAPNAILVTRSIRETEPRMETGPYGYLCCPVRRPNGGKNGDHKDGFHAGHAVPENAVAGQAQAADEGHPAGSPGQTGRGK